VFGAKKVEYQRKSVTSTDGTTIGYRELGAGPGVILMHGGALASQHYMKLGSALADRFTVYLPDRRGRGMSGPYGPDYCIAREDEDLRAVADGGLFALHASMTIPALRKVAVFEPVIFVDQPGLADFVRLIDRGSQRIEQGDIPGAMAGLATDAQDYRGESVSAPYRVAGWLMSRRPVCQAILWADARRVRGDDVALADLIRAWKPELDLVKATAGTLDDYRKVTAEVLLICGTQAPPLFTGTQDALESVLPHSRRIALAGLNHGAPQDQGGRPDLIAEQLRSFFGS
jgi:pimeloyl-ACP methyl ester carboxylesterase